MNKTTLFALSLAALSFFACAEEKDPPPTHSELCAQKPLPKECIIGSWSFDGVKDGSGTIIEPSKGSLELKSDGSFSFTCKNCDTPIDSEGGTSWELDGSKITVEYLELSAGKISGTISFTDSATTMIITSTGERTPFSLTGDDGSNETRKESFTWQW